MKSVLLSINPRWVEKIFKGEKTIEVRKTNPKLETPFKCYIYCTIGNGVKGDVLLPSEIVCGKVVGEFVCDWITKIKPHCDIKDCVNQYSYGYPAILGDKDCLTLEELKSYLGNKDGYAWHISDLKIYDKPKDLSEFTYVCPHKSKCENCKRSVNEELPFGEISIGCYIWIDRPPQSWCYVEEL